MIPADDVARIAGTEIYTFEVNGRPLRVTPAGIFAAGAVTAGVYLLPHVKQLLDWVMGRPLKKLYDETVEYFDRKLTPGAMKANKVLNNVLGNNHTVKLTPQQEIEAIRRMITGQPVFPGWAAFLESQGIENPQVFMGISGLTPEKAVIGIPLIIKLQGTLRLTREFEFLDNYARTGLESWAQKIADVRTEGNLFDYLNNMNFFQELDRLYAAYPSFYWAGDIR